MPLGSNIKRDKLIPASKEEEKKKKPVAKKAKATKAKAEKPKAKKAVSKPKAKAESKPAKKAVKKVVKKAEDKLVKVAPKPVEQKVVAPVQETQIAPDVIQPKVIVKEVPVQVIAEPRKVFQQPMLTAEQIAERKKLKDKYDNEINSLRGSVQQMISFQLGADKYAIEIGKIKEVVPTPKVSKIPHAPEFVKGVANIRGTMMVILDLAEKFELREEGEFDIEKLPFTMVIESEYLKVGILLKEVPTTLKVLGDIIESSAGLLTNTALEETYIKGLIKLNDDVIIYIDIIDLIESEEVKLAAQAAIT